MASSRRLPTSYNVATYGVGKSYTALTTWEAATDNDLVTATKGEVLECYDNDAIFVDGVSLFGATTDSSYFRVIKPATGEGHNGTPNIGVHFDVGNPCLEISEEYSQIQDLIFSNPTGDTEHYGAIVNRATAAMVGCIGIGGNWDRGTFYNSSQAGTMINCIAIEGLAGYYSDGAAKFYNCTAVDCTTGFNAVAGNPIAKNCISCDNTTDFSGTWTKTTCYEGDATVFANQAGDDYHLAAADTTCRGEGTDLSSDATYAFDDDIDGETRSAWDIGFDEYSASGWAGTILGVASPASVMGVAAADIANVMGV